MPSSSCVFFSTWFAYSTCMWEHLIELIKSKYFCCYQNMFPSNSEFFGIGLQVFIYDAFSRGTKNEKKEKTEPNFSLEWKFECLENGLFVPYNDPMRCEHADEIEPFHPHPSSVTKLSYLILSKILSFSLPLLFTRNCVAFRRRHWIEESMHEGNQVFVKFIWKALDFLDDGNVVITWIHWRQTCARVWFAIRRIQFAHMVYVYVYFSVRSI